MSRKLSLLLAIAGCVLTNCLTSKGEATPQAKPDKMPTVIVYAIDAIEPEKKAADELKTYLMKISGGNYSLQAEDKVLNGASAIYVGQTAFAKKAGIDLGTFVEEEYILRTIGRDLVIGGGRPNGTWNGVQYFLQRELGCRFFSWDCEVIPRRESLALPKLDLRRVSSIAGRHIYMAYLDFTPEAKKKMADYCRRNYMNAYQSAYDRQSKSADATRLHNEFFWVEPQKYAASNPEFFTNKGKFVNLPKERGRNQEGSLCWTNRQVWEITLAELRKVIKNDRTGRPEWEWPRVYYIYQNDITQYCHCAQCESVFAAEGSRAGALLQYVNFVAEGIADEYPDVNVLASAYVETEILPKTIRPATNVMIALIDLYTRSDCYRPITSEFNAARKAVFDSWKKTGVKDYWNMGFAAPYFSPPRIETMLDSLAPDLRYYAASGAKYYFTEAEFCHENPQNFWDLQNYLGLQLMADVTLNEEVLIKEYLVGYYGSAAPAMEAFLTLLRQAVKNEKTPLIYITNPVRTYTNGAFLEKVYRLLKQAQAAVPPGSDYYRRVQQEMITPLAVILLNPQYDFCKRTGLKKEDLVAEYRVVRLNRIEQPWISAERQKQNKARLEKDLTEMLLEIPVPEHLKECKKILKFAYPDMLPGYRAVSIESDPDSPLGKAMVSRGTAGQEDAQHDLAKPFAGGLYPNSFGIYSQSDKRNAGTIRTDVPQDEKYHWYKINAFDFGPNTSLWGFYWYASVNLNSAFAAADGISGYNIWETWISVKYTGPAYVKGSMQKNGVFLERVILVKPQSDPKKPGGGYSINLKDKATVYLFVANCGEPTVPSNWKLSELKAVWGPFAAVDKIYQLEADAGVLEIPEHDGINGSSFGVPHACVIVLKK